MPNLKDIKTRIGSVKKTRQITQAMKLVAGARLRRATEAAVSARPYQERLAEVLERVASRIGDKASDPLLEPRTEVKRVLLVVLTTDRGLCGGFNSTLLRRTLDFLEDKQNGEDLDVTIRVYGRKGVEFLKYRGWSLDATQTDYGGTDKMELVRPLTQTAVAEFLEGTFDEVYVAYNEFVSTITQRPTFKPILPLAVGGAESAQAADDDEVRIDYRYEPSAQDVLSELLPLYLRTLVLQAFLETEAGEYAARMTAMDNATRNANELIDGLTLEYNRARQAAITTEITEIVSGAEAL